ncbi:hypothetical protein VNO78_24059 [Psophocarpus tetragonolobus]|uniref:argininosuccinate synthase n=1 Tax=Psophocarpus tetragonolobus TaxID=3891 RepID=A0AAN9S7U7_PSOTE
MKRFPLGFSAGKARKNNGSGESREEFRERARRRGPINLTESVDQILSGYISLIHCSLIIGENFGVAALGKEMNGAKKINEMREEERGFFFRENYGCEVVCFTADVGQGIKELEGLEQKAKSSGACQLVVNDLREEFVKDYIFPYLRAGAVYERKYLLGTSMALPAMVDVAKKLELMLFPMGVQGKEMIRHFRFELTFFALNPKLNVVAPWREWDITEREDAIEYAKKHNIPVPGDILEDPANEPKKYMYMMPVDLDYAPDEAEYIKIGIESGLPVLVNGKRLSPASLLTELNEIGGKHGIGQIEMVENQLLGMKSRGVYETPGGTILFAAARELESLTLIEK